MITHRAIQRHIQYYEPVEQFTVAPYTFKLYALYEEGFNMDYRFAFIVFEQNKPIVALGYEMGFLGTNFLGITLPNQHLNYGRADESMDILDFRAWALEHVIPYVPAIAPQALQPYAAHPNVAVDALSATRFADEMEKVHAKHATMQLQIDDISKRLRPFTELIEYRVIKDFDLNKNTLPVQFVPIEQVQLVVLGEETLQIAAILFDKEQFDVPAIFTWLLKHDVVFAASASFDSRNVRAVVEIDTYTAAVIEKSSMS